MDKQIHNQVMSPTKRTARESQVSSLGVVQAVSPAKKTARGRFVSSPCKKLSEVLEKECKIDVRTTTISPTKRAANNRVTFSPCKKLSVVLEKECKIDVRTTTMFPTKRAADNRATFSSCKKLSVVLEKECKIDVRTTTISPIKIAADNRATFSPCKKLSVVLEKECKIDVRTTTMSPTKIAANNRATFSPCKKLSVVLETECKIDVRTTTMSPTKRAAKSRDTFSPCKTLPEELEKEWKMEKSPPNLAMSPTKGTANDKGTFSSCEKVTTEKECKVEESSLDNQMLSGYVTSPHKQKLNHLLPKTQPSPQKKQISSRNKFSSSKESALTSAAPFIDPLDEVQSIMRQHISQSNQPQMIHGYESEKKHLYDLIKRTATTGESNSLLLIGPRGCGKSMLMRNVVENLFKDAVTKENMQLVQLNGLLQTDDKIALREITRQLQLENTVGDRVFGSFAETLQFLLQALKKGDQGSKPILFVLDEFDLFAQHKNQTLLYNLFDVAQSAQAPICVIGITCRLDVVELLEKRVKSRFSHRQLHLFNKLTLSQYKDLCKSYLCLPTDFPDQNFASDWNQSIEDLLQEISVKDILERQFSLTNNVRGLLSLLTYPICQVSSTHPKITANDLILSFKILSMDTKSSMLHGISTLELCLIIAMKHLTEIYEGEPFNFEMVYSEYLKFARRRSGIQIYEKPVVMKAYEHLQSLELISCHSGNSQTQKEYKLMTLLVHPSQVLDCLQAYPACPTEIKQWAIQTIS